MFKLLLLLPVTAAPFLGGCATGDPLKAVAPFPSFLCCSICCACIYERMGKSVVAAWPFVFSGTFSLNVFGINILNV